MFYFCHLKKLVRPETFGHYYVIYIKLEGLDCICLALNVKNWRVLVNTDDETSGSIKRGKILD